MSDIEEVISDLDKVVEILDKIRATTIPTSLKNAISEEWNGDQINELFLDLVPYKERAKDRTRVVKLEEAVNWLRDFEDELVFALTDNLNSVIVQNLTATVTGTISALKNVTTIWRFKSVLLYVLKNISKALSVDRLARMAGPVFRLVRKYDWAMPGLLFQQQSAPRMRVKKITRL